MATITVKKQSAAERELSRMIAALADALNVSPESLGQRQEMHLKLDLQLDRIVRLANALEIR